jgi:hypothetical protein
MFLDAVVSSTGIRIGHADALVRPVAEAERP